MRTSRKAAAGVAALVLALSLLGGEDEVPVASPASAERVETE
jgi:hypothetical protein